VKCAPPANKPLPDEAIRCGDFLNEEMDALDRARVIVCLGGFAWDQALRILGVRGCPIPRPRPRFGHGREAEIHPFTLIGSYHPSQQNTFTGRLTEPMLDDVFAAAKRIRGEIDVTRE